MVRFRKASHCFGCAIANIFSFTQIIYKLTWFIDIFIKFSDAAILEIKKINLEEVIYRMEEINHCVNY